MGREGNECDIFSPQVGLAHSNETLSSFAMVPWHVYEEEKQELKTDRPTEHEWKLLNMSLSGTHRY